MITKENLRNQENRLGQILNKLDQRRNNNKSLEMQFAKKNIIDRIPYKYSGS